MLHDQLMRQVEARQAQILGQKSPNHSPDVNQLTSLQKTWVQLLTDIWPVYVGLEDRATQNGCFPEQRACICKLLAISQILHPLEYQITQVCSASEINDKTNLT